MDKEKIININASLVEEPVFSSFEKDGKEVKVANFTLVKKYGGGKEYTKCSVYGEKSEMIRDIKKGDFTKRSLNQSRIFTSTMCMLTQSLFLSSLMTLLFFSGPAITFVMASSISSILIFR